MAENKNTPIENEEIKNDVREELMKEEINTQASANENNKKEESKSKNKKKSKRRSKTYSQKEMDAVAEELLKTQKQRDEFLEMAQRQKAEFDNFRKRSEAQRLEANGNGARDTIASILPVIDNMHRALVQCENVSDSDPLKQGIVMVFRQFDETLKGLGLENIDALGKEFDPNMHHAVMEGEASEDYPAGTVMEVLQDGYIVKEKIIRYAMVKVAK